MKRTMLSLLLAAFTVGCAVQKTPYSFSNAENGITPSSDSSVSVSQNTEDDLYAEGEVISLSVPPADDGIPLTQSEQLALQTRVLIEPTVDNNLLDLETQLAPEDKLAVELQFKYFTHRGRVHFERYLQRLEHYLPYIEEVFTRRGIPKEIAYLALIESGFNPNAISRAGAAGMWQFMPATGRQYGLRQSWWIDERRDPYKATEAAADYLLTLHSFFGDWFLALASYNAGEGKIGRALKKTGTEGFFDLLRKNHTLNYRARLRTETQQYVPKFIAAVKILRNLEALGFNQPNFNNALNLKSVQVKQNTDLQQLAKNVGLSWKEFSQYNPAFLRQISPNNIVATAYVPHDKHAIALAYLSTAQPSQNNGWRTYVVRRGDTLSGIAAGHNIPVSVIAQVNTLPKVLQPGQKLMIPNSARSYIASAKSTSSNTKLKKQSYKVKEGDSLYTIAKRFNTTISAIAQTNKINTNAVLKKGLTLTIPTNRSYVAVTTAQRTYRVQKGDTIWGIARKFDVSINTILKLNNMTARATLKPGETLKIIQ
ncbi:MAG: LysM peptidoglycan-binding domain-containing protein [Desulfovibrionaceae bacterium]